MFVVWYKKAQIPLDAKCAKLDSVFYHGILNIKMFGTKLKCFGENLVRVIVPNAVSGSQD